MTVDFHHAAPGEEEDVLNTITRALATVEGCRPERMELSLNDYVDLDAVERLTGHTGHDGYLSFAVGTYRVLVFPTGDVVVYG